MKEKGRLMDSADAVRRTSIYAMQKAKSQDKWD
jgi:hypothetical protein